MPRLFVGLELTDSHIASTDIARSGVEGAHWQRDDQLHLTLAFMGNVTPKVARDIEGELSRVSMIPFALQLRGVGFFGKPGQPKTLWAGVEDSAPLVHLHEKITFAMERMGVKVDQRRFIPHVTLARFRRGAPARIGSWLSNNETLASPMETMDRFTLFSSHLTHEGAFYRAEAQYGSMDFSGLAEDYADHYDEWSDSWPDEQVAHA